MGAGNAFAALNLWGPRLARYHASRVALTVIALTSMDGAEDPAYWGGPSPIASALGLSGSVRSQQKGVREALVPLLRVGAITTIEKGSQGRRAKYRLNLKPLVDAADVPRG